MEATVRHGSLRAEYAQQLLDSATPKAYVTILVLALAGVVILSQWRAAGQPQQLWDPVPFVFNTLQFLNNNEKFMVRVLKAFKKSNLAKFYLGPAPVYLVNGPHNVQAIFGRSTNVGTEEIFEKNVFPVLYRLPKKFVQRFTDDRSGRGRKPAPGNEGMPEEKRYWAMYGFIHNEYLARATQLKPIMEVFRTQFTERLNQYPVDKWSSVGVMDFCREEMTECAMATLLGPKVFELNTGFREAFWEFDDNVFMLTLGLPKWLNPGPYKIQERYLGMMSKYVKAAWESFDWDGPDAESFWEPHFGARVCRETAKWLKTEGCPDESIVGALATLVFAQNSNTIVTTMWCIIEVIKDTSILQAVREEVRASYAEHAVTGKLEIDIEKLVQQPLLQSIFTEVLRLHMNFNIIRHIKEPMTMEGFSIDRGAMLQAPMMAAHYDEAVWGASGRPASEFWAERHIRMVEESDESGIVKFKRTFAVAARPSSFFPFGGGPQICPGRHLAKHEILTAVALLVDKLDIEFVQWTNEDGSPSNLAAENDPRYCGFGAAPPNRDMKLRWRRRLEQA